MRSKQMYDIKSQYILFLPVPMDIYNLIFHVVKLAGTKWRESAINSLL